MLLGYLGSLNLSQKLFNIGHALYGLWNYEVVEIFFLASNDAEMYIELEFGPYGHHLGLLLHGRRNCLIHSFPITYNAKIGTSANLIILYIITIYFQVMTKGEV